MVGWSLIASGAFDIAKSVFFGGGLSSAITDITGMLERKEISAQEAAARIEEAQARAWSEASIAHSNAASEAFEEAQKTIRESFTAKSWFARNAWAFIVWSQTTVLLWYQVGIPFYVHFFGGTFPRTGDDLLYWAYALIAGALGIGAIQSSTLKLPFKK